MSASLLPVVLFALYLAAERHIDETEHARHEAEVLARMTAAAHTQILAQSKQLLAGLVVGSHSWDGALLGDDCSAQLRRVIDVRPLYKQVVVARPSGTVYCSAEPLERPIVLDQREAFTEALVTKEGAHTGIGDSRLTGEKAITLAQPLKDQDGSVIAVLVAVLGLDWLTEQLACVPLPPGSVAALVDAEGTILWSYPAASSVGRTILDAESFKRAIRTADGGVVEERSLDGIPRLRAYAKLADLPGTGVYLRLGIPMAEIRQPALHALLTMLFGLVLVLMVALWGSWKGSSILVVQPLRHLGRAAARLGKGDLAARTGLAHEPNEIGELATRFDQLAEHLQRTNRALRTLSAGSRLIVRERHQHQLLQSMCVIAVESGGYLAAIVTSAPDETGRRMHRMAIAGASIDVFGMPEEMNWANRMVEEMATAAMAGARGYVARITSDPAVAAEIRDGAQTHGFSALASFPLSIDDTVIGAFTLIAPECNAFDGDELTLLDELAADLSFGVATVRSRQRLDEAEQVVRRASTHDLLTGLPNASAFLGRATENLADARAARESVMVLVLHLARLQDVYDSVGYEPGNQIVREIAMRLGRLAGLDGDFARLGLEDFAITLKNVGAREAEAAAAEILAQCRVPVRVSGVHFEVQASVGASYFPGHGEEADLLVRRATIAARDAARRGVPFSPYLGVTERENPERLALAADLRQAIEERRLTLQYQPKVEVTSGRTVSCEALIRWNHPRKGPIPPAQFVPIAEQTGLIREMTYFVVEAAVRQQRVWLEEGRPLPIAVNLSVRNLYDSELISRIDGLLSTWGIPAELIEFEITESALMEDPAVAHAAVAKLRGKGSKISIDDFGTGYSSLSYLVSLPVHALKIDRAFVVQMTKSKAAYGVVASIVSMAHGLGLRVIAEGVETAEELESLRILRCDEVQGYLTGRPVAAQDLERHAYALEFEACLRD